MGCRDCVPGRILTFASGSKLAGLSLEQTMEAYPTHRRSGRRQAAAAARLKRHAAQHRQPRQDARSTMKTTAFLLMMLLPAAVSAQQKPTTGYAPVNGVNMYYEVHGNGEPVVLLRG